MTQPTKLFETGSQVDAYVASLDLRRLGGADVLRYACGCWGVWVAQNTPPDDYWQGVRVPCAKHS